MPQLGAMSWTPDLARPKDTPGTGAALMQMTFNDAGNFLSDLYCLYYFQTGTPIITMQQPYARRKGVELNAGRVQARLENEILKG
ncbi:hypothetical protein [Pseudomonas petrae]|uniref:Uncharacterized protein n=1 Tax=Pseudomonas petrae TaxID=2912190 RepID=A0ABS9I0P2_9PSED|nr:hypothetical protein [Pseudomonas petrae]MCF7539887.1 hypothetical protein [Pseudomonas petrae]MCF7541373.1 hypothetical protein [Pseudomonas petrae]MCF7558295.1 hypothetical protein [Pseudomonas petrae]